jgi:radical SAM protein with 4Fe4S-binding SPASM domain
MLDHVSGGNVLKTDLKKILFESELFTKIIHRENLGGKCGSCKFNYTCGGCRVMAYFQTGDVFAEDPTCFIDDLSDEELAKLETLTAKEFKKYYRMTKFSNIFKTPGF